MEYWELIVEIFEDWEVFFLFFWILCDGLGVEIVLFVKNVFMFKFK